MKVYSSPPTKSIRDSDSDDDIDDRVSTGNSSTHHHDAEIGSACNDDDGEKEVEALINAEDHSVRLWRLIVAIMLFSTAMLVTIYTYKFLADQERQYFETSVSTVQW
jgi:hypothetical protein